MYERLMQAGVSAQLVIVSNAGHAFVSPNGNSTPTLAEINQIILDFLEHHLK
jgi:acetyl esterase/lipase